MASKEELRAERIKKLQKLKEAGYEAFPARVKKTHTVSELLRCFEELVASKQTYSIVGRVMSIRKHGRIMFVDCFDGTSKMQVTLKADVVGDDSFDFFNEVSDRGDFISFSGVLFVTGRGVQSLLVSSWMIATKSLLPIPEEYTGFTNEEERYRKRYLDVLMHDEVRTMIELRSKFWRSARDYMLEQGFLEIETPTLETTTGGAEARPFVAHHNDFDMPVYLRICIGELWQKRALAAGFPKVFEIGRAYRNEGSSPEHLQEFTNMEFYAAYMDYREGRIFIENMIKHVVQNTFGTLEFIIKEMKVDFSGDWEIVDYSEYVESKTGINVITASEEQMKNKLDELGVVYEGSNRERFTDTLWKYCRKNIAGPLWLTNHPKIVSPLAKAMNNDSQKTERLQLIFGGSEHCNSFSELNDPIEQRARFEEQQELINRGDDEAMMADWEFVEMLEYGMPPAFGAATVGDRMFAMLYGKPIRETVLFPLMKPKHDDVK